jgi:hypothetical protein
MDEALPAVPEFELASLRALLGRSDRLRSFGDARAWLDEAREWLADLDTLRREAERSRAGK